MRADAYHITSPAPEGAGAARAMRHALAEARVGPTDVQYVNAHGTSTEINDALETQAGTVFGTPRYMSPEQAQAKPLDARSDLYSLGVILYQMIVGRAPFVDDDAVVVMARHIKSVAVPPHEAAPDAEIQASP